MLRGYFITHLERMLLMYLTFLAITMFLMAYVIVQMMLRNQPKRAPLPVRVRDRKSRRY